MSDRKLMIVLKVMIMMMNMAIKIGFYVDVEDGGDRQDDDEYN